MKLKNKQFFFICHTKDFSDDFWQQYHSVFLSIQDWEKDFKCFYSFSSCCAVIVNLFILFNFSFHDFNICNGSKSQKKTINGFSCPPTITAFSSLAVGDTASSTVALWMSDR